MRINSRKIRKILGRVRTAPKRIFETFCTQEALDASAWMQHSQLFIWFRKKSNKGFSYTIFPVKKNKCWNFFKLCENRYLIILSIHILKLEISGCDKNVQLWHEWCLARVVGPIILFADSQGVCLVELWLWKKLLWAVNCEKSWCELWTVKKADVSSEVWKSWKPFGSNSCELWKELLLARKCL
jgi:hypothetical protein